MGEESERLTRFGVELEICWKYGEDLCGYPVLQTEYEAFNDSPFLFKCLMFFFSMILNNPNQIILGWLQQNTPELGILYTDEEDEIQRAIFDVRDPGTASNPNYTVLESKYDPRFSQYMIPIFTEDISLQCGDTREDHKRKYKPANHQPLSPMSMGIECITPVLAIYGEVTEQKVAAALAPFLACFGLLSPHCFFTNYSTGFHVNVSLVDKDGPIRLNCEKFRNFFIPEYIRYESQMYSKVRTRLREGQEYSIWATPLKQVQANALAIENETNRANTLHAHHLLSTKHWAVLLKQGSVYEFRLYGSETNWEKLVEYTFQACHLLNHIYDRYLDKKAKGLLGGRVQTRRLRLRRRSRRLR